MAEDLLVIAGLKPWTCTVCGTAYDAGRMLRMEGRHAGERSSGRVGLTLAGRQFDPDPARLAVVAAVRHEDTDYELLLAGGVPRLEARDRVRGDIDRVLAGWQGSDGH